MFRKTHHEMLDWPCLNRFDIRTLPDSPACEYSSLVQRRTEFAVVLDGNSIDATSREGLERRLVANVVRNSAIRTSRVLFDCWEHYDRTEERVRCPCLDFY